MTDSFCPRHTDGRHIFIHPNARLMELQCACGMITPWARTRQKPDAEMPDGPGGPIEFRPHRDDVQLIDGVLRPVPWAGDEHHKVKRMQALLRKHERSSLQLGADRYVMACPECHHQHSHKPDCEWAELMGGERP
jgi:hypothetical protein